jgi:class I fructose-bisphosphate aldolase
MSASVVSVRLGQLRHKEGGGIVGVAFDHGGSGVPEGGAEIQRICEQVTASPAQALLLGPGLALRAGALLARPGAPRLVVSVDVPIFSPGGGHVLEDHRRLVSVESAVGLGATAVKVLLPVGRVTAKELGDSVQIVSTVVEEAHRLGVPVMVEPALWGPLAKQEDELILHSNRMAIELGADLLKTVAPVAPEALAQLIDNSPVPVVILGGSARSRSDLVYDIARWIAAGATGVVVGRNVWMAKDPVLMVEALAAVVHGRSAEEAIRILEKAEVGGDAL